MNYLDRDGLYHFYQTIDEKLASKISGINAIGSIEIHVAKTGNDETGDGSLEKPVLTIAKGLDLAAEYYGNTVHICIIIHEGIYEEIVEISGFHSILLYAYHDGEDYDDVTINGMISAYACCRVAMNMLNILCTATPSSWCIRSEAVTFCNIIRCKLYYENSNAANVLAYGVFAVGSIVQIINCEISNTGYAAIYAYNASYVYAEANTGSTNNIALRTHGGTIMAAGTIPDATTNTSPGYSGQIFTS